jgi:hypothetical protein
MPDADSGDSGTADFAGAAAEDLLAELVDELSHDRHTTQRDGQPGAAPDAPAHHEADDEDRPSPGGNGHGAGDPGQ